MRPLLIHFALFGMIACAGIPGILPASQAEKEAIVEKSREPFLKGKWRLIHSINGTLPGGSTVSMIGISIAMPENAALHCTLMSIEGFVFLDAEYDGTLSIKRGIGPFKDKSFVMGIIHDVRLILFPPRGIVTEAGPAADGSLVCRYRTEDGETDVVMKPDGSTEVYVFDESGQRARLVTFGSERKAGVPAGASLTGYGMFKYSLDLDLIEAERL